MRWLHVLTHAIRSLFSRRAIDAQIDADIAFHIDEAAAEYEREGLPPDQARRAALAAFGNPLYVRDDVREVSPWIWWERLAQDVRHSLRGFRRTPVVAIAAVVSIALGIGASTAIFSLFHALVLRPLPVLDPGSLYQVVHRGDAGTFESSTYDFYAHLKARSGLVSGVLQVDPAFARRVVIDGQAESVATQRVTGDFYGVLGVTPALGMVVRPADENGGTPNRVAVLGHAYWVSRFGGSSDVLGRTLRIDDVDYTIVGVTGPEFFGLQAGRRADVTVPVDGTDEPSYWKSRALVVRLAPGVSREAAVAGLDAAFQQYLRAGTPMPAEARARAFKALDLESASAGLPEFREQYGRAVQVAMAIVGLLLLLGCANLASLFLARTASRQRDLSVCLALGAHRRRLARQVLSESLLVAIAGGIAGVALAVWGVNVLVRLLPDYGSPLDLRVGVDRAVLLFGLTATMLTGIAIGLAPVALTRRVDLRDALAASGRSVSIGGRTFRSLVVMQVALSTMLVIAATLLVTTLGNLRAQPLGFRPDGVLLVTVDADGSGLEDARLAAMHMTMLERLQALPGVRRVTMATNPPLGSNEDGKPIAIAGKTIASADDGVMQVNIVGPDFFETFGIPVVRGRGITSDDTAAARRVVVVSQSMARHYFPGEDPIGKRMDIGRGQTGGQIEIVGVAADVRYRNLRTPAPRMLYVPAQQRDAEEEIVFALGTNGDAALWAQPAQRTLRTLAPSMLTANVKTLSAMKDERLVNERLLALLSGSFGVLALLLAAVGVYGVLAYSVSIRTPELGLRIALGANRVGVLWLILRSSLSLVAAGVVIGSLAAFLSGSLLTGVLFEVETADPWVYWMATALLVATGLVAALGPTLRATRIDPAETLRYS